jgi:hypothetical protein
MSADQPFWHWGSIAFSLSFFVFAGVRIGKDTNDNRQGKKEWLSNGLPM